jgi:O-antigen ligase
MFKEQELTAFADKNKAVIWGLFLSTIIFRFAVGNLSLAVLALVFFAQVLANKSIRVKAYIFPLVGYFLFGVVSLIWTTNYHNTFTGIGISLPLLLIPFFSAQYADFEPKEIKKAVKIFSISLLFYMLICLLVAGFRYVQDQQTTHFFYHDLVSVFDNNAIYVSLAVAACILYLLTNAEKKRFDYLILFCLILFLLLLSSKNIIITTFCLIGLSVFKSQRALKSSLVISVLFGLAFMIVLLSDNPIKQRFVAETHLNVAQVLKGQDFYDYKFSGLEIRLFQWRIMGEMISQGQLGFWGLGLHNVDYLLEQYFSYYNAYKGYFQINFHNQYLQTFGEIGIGGLFLLLGVFGYLIYQSFKQKEAYKLYFCLLFMSAFFTESFLNRQKGIFLFAAFFCLQFMSCQSAYNKRFKINL